MFPYVPPSLVSLKPRLTRPNSRIPFYHAEEATDAVMPVIKDHYHKEERSFLGQLWSTWNTCKYVEADPAVPGTLKWGKN